jgi:hypothetical protein
MTTGDQRARMRSTTSETERALDLAVASTVDGS